MEQYKPRIIDKKVEEYLKVFGSICIEGPKWCGKTWTSSYHSKSKILIGSPENNFQNRKLAELSPEIVLEGDTPRLIDEWQGVPPLWDAVRYKIDQLLLRSLARNESTTASNKTLKSDIKEIDDEDIHAETVAEYLDIFKRLFLLENQPSFATKILSSVRVKQVEKRHFVDPSLPCALLRATPERLIDDLETFVFLFEALCERDLNIYADAFGGNLYHYQDYSGKEIDAVIEMPDGRWCAFEIKLGANRIDEGANNLISLKAAIEQEPNGVPPSVLCVVCGMSNAAYKREDGVFVVPLTALKN